MAENANRRLSREVEEAIQDYLGKIARRMKSSGSDAAESRAVLDDLETQIRTLLAEKGPEPTWNDLASVLSKMDSPDKFSSGAESRRSLRPAVVFAGILLVVGAAVAGALRAARPGSPAIADGAVSEPVDPPAAESEPAATALPPVATESVAEAIAAEPAPAGVAEPEKIPVAIASFSSAANVREADTVRRALADGLINALAQRGDVRVVERERIAEALQDLRMSSEGLIDQATALQLGKMTGARVIVTGNILQLDDELVITARLINTETSELVATRANGSRGNLLAVVDELAAGVAERLVQDDKGTLARANDLDAARKAEQRQALQDQLKGLERPRLLVLLPESHLNRIVPDPAGETELVEWLLACGFPVASAEYAGIEAPTPAAQWDSETDVRIRRPDVRDGVQWLISSRSIHSFVTGGMSKDADKLLEIADVLILGQGISERASTRSGIQSCKARLELKAIDIKTGEVLLAKSTYGAGLDVAEHIAGKRALQAAGRQMALDLLPALAKRWTEIRSSVPAKGTP
ncbi:MAG: FlgO family outer membrane protein [Kiritimatiellia bacterium]